MVRRIENRRATDQNIMKNFPGGKRTQQEFTWPPEIVRSFEERDSVIAALQVFLQINRSNLKLQGRDCDLDLKLIAAAERVLGRVGC